MTKGWNCPIAPGVINNPGDTSSKWPASTSHGKQDAIGMAQMVKFLAWPSDFGSSACAFVPTVGGNSAG